MGFSRQEYWIGLLCPPSGDLKKGSQWIYGSGPSSMCSHFTGSHLINLVTDFLCLFYLYKAQLNGCNRNAEHWKIDAFELWCWRRLLRVPWIVRRSNQSILKEISPGCSLEGMMLKVKLQYFGHLMRRVDSWCWEGLGAGGEGDDRAWDGWMASPTQWTRVWVNPGSWWWTGRPGVLRFMGS